MDIIFREFWGIFAVAQQIINGNNQLHWSFSLTLTLNNSGGRFDFIFLE